MMDLVENNES